MKSNEIKQYTPLLIELLKRDIKVKYRKSVLGVLWSVLNPLFMMIILSVVFSTLFKNNVENYPTYIFSGQLIYFIIFSLRQQHRQCLRLWIMRR